ncbi:hypothetical protein HanLR1_Chr17g0659281 [Helianthus annuus]|nr:hypothetical protein HanHA89_Chr17g0700661 [Helianthus annuus]KAJ0631918.1 hypothetical protein HanLR1_Chr17g0659281 [Helianthus annuus]
MLSFSFFFHFILVIGLYSYATSHLLQIPGSKPLKRCIHIWLCLFRSKDGRRHMIA